MLQSKNMMESTARRTNAGFDYENQVKTRLRMPDREEWHAVLSIRVHTQAVGTHKDQVLNIELTDDSDPLFLHILKCTEADFIALKSEQGLMFDFQDFPCKLVDLLEQCPVVRKSMKALDEGESEKFSCTMLIGHSAQSNFSIVEANRFKILTHLSLGFTEADDKTAKHYLANKLQEFKADNSQLKQRLESVEDRLSLQSETSDKLKAELRTEKEDSERLADSIKLDAQRQFNELKQQMLQDMERQSAEHMQEKNRVASKLQEQVEELSGRLAGVVERKEELEGRVLKVEASERELQAKVQRQEHEIELKQNELDLLRSTNKNLDTTKYSQEKSLVELRVKCETMEKQLQDKESLVRNANSLYEASKLQCVQLEETVAILKGNVAKVEERAEASAQETKKASEKVVELQTDLKAAKQKVKLNEGVCVQQEQLISQNKQTTEELTRSLTDAKREVAHKDEEIKLCNSKIEELKTKLAESQKMLESNEQSTLHLNSRSDSLAEQGNE